MPTPVENLTAFAGFIIGIVASMAIGSITRLVGQDSPGDDED